MSIQIWIESSSRRSLIILRSSSARYVAIAGYDMAGKTGTANIAVGGKYSSTEFVASFVGMVPASHPSLLGLVVVDEPQGSVYGGSVAAPAFQKIVGWAVPYLGISPRQSVSLAPPAQIRRPGG